MKLTNRLALRALAARPHHPRHLHHASTAALSLALEQQRAQHQARRFEHTARASRPPAPLDAREQRFDRTWHERAELKLAADEPAADDEFPSTHLIEHASLANDAVHHPGLKATAELFTQTELGAAPWRGGADAAAGEAAAAAAVGENEYDDVPDVKHRGVGAIDEGVDGLREAGFMDDLEARALATPESRDIRHDALAAPKAHPEGAGNIYAVDEQYSEFAVRILDMTESDFHDHRSATSADHDVTAARMSFTETGERAVSYSRASVEALAMSAAADANHAPPVDPAAPPHFAAGLTGDPKVGAVLVHPEVAPSPVSVAQAAAAVAAAARRAAGAGAGTAAAASVARDEAVAAAAAVNAARAGESDQWRPEPAAAGEHAARSAAHHDALKAMRHNPAAPAPGSSRGMHSSSAARREQQLEPAPQRSVMAAAALAMARMHRPSDDAADAAPAVAWQVAAAEAGRGGDAYLRRLARADRQVLARAALLEVVRDAERV